MFTVNNYNQSIQAVQVNSTKEAHLQRAQEVLAQTFAVCDPFYPSEASIAAFVDLPTTIVDEFECLKFSFNKYLCVGYGLSQHYTQNGFKQFDYHHDSYYNPKVYHDYYNEYWKQLFILPYKFCRRYQGTYHYRGLEIRWTCDTFDGYIIEVHAEIRCDCQNLWYPDLIINGYDLPKNRPFMTLSQIIREGIDDYMPTIQRALQKEIKITETKLAVLKDLLTATNNI